MSDFFRISLSQGRDWIPLADEVKHLQGYLTIQKIRYRDILDYEIDIPYELYHKEILKTAHPAAREKTRSTTASNTAEARAWFGSSRGKKTGRWSFSVTDNGAGMTPRAVAAGARKPGIGGRRPNGEAVLRPHQRQPAHPTLLQPAKGPAD